MKKLLVAMVAALALMFASGPARADNTVEFGEDDNGNDYTLVGQSDGLTGIQWHDRQNDHWWFFVFDQDGNLRFRIDQGGSDPSPEDSGKGTEKPDAVKQIAEAIRQAMLNDKDGKLSMVPPSFWASPIGQYLIGQGGGIIPKYQPGDDDNNRVGAKKPAGKFETTDKDKIAEKQLEKMEKRLVPAASGYEPNSGSYADYVKGLAKSGPKGGGGGGDDDKSGSGNPHDKDKVKGHGLFSGDMPGPPELVNPNPVRVVNNALKCTSKARGAKSCKVTLASGRVLAFNVPSADIDKKASPHSRTRKSSTAATAQKTVNCAPNMTPNASGKGCVPKLDMGSDFTPGSMPGTSRSAPAAVGGGTPAGRR